MTAILHSMIFKLHIHAWRHKQTQIHTHLKAMNLLYNPIILYNRKNATITHMHTCKSHSNPPPHPRMIISFFIRRQLRSMGMEKAPFRLFHVTVFVLNTNTLEIRLHAYQCWVQGKKIYFKHKKRKN